MLTQGAARSSSGSGSSSRPKALDQVPVSRSDVVEAFLLVDPQDGTCLAGNAFKKCSLRTLWYLTGQEGAYSVHHYPAHDEDDTHACLQKTNCAVSEAGAALGSCDHCGSRQWDLVREVGTTQGSYILTQAALHCLRRTKTGPAALLGPCEAVGFTRLQLQIVHDEDLEAMSTPGATLVTAAAEGDLTAVRRLLQRAKVSPDARDWSDMTALMAACANGDMEMASYLLAEGADASLTDTDGVSALHEAALGGHHAIAVLLMQRPGGDAYVHVRASNGVSALWLAAAKGHDVIVAQCLKRKANANVAREDAVTALMAASSAGAAEAVRLLLRSRADPNLEDTNGITALALAAQAGHTTIVQELLRFGAETSPVDAEAQHAASPLVSAAAGGHATIVRLLLEAGAAMALCPDGASPLMHAAAGGHAEVCSYLLQQGASVNFRHNNGSTPLLAAAAHGDEATIRLLLEQGASAVAADADGVTALMWAAYHGDAAMCERLVQEGVPVSTATTTGETALSFAARAGHSDIVHYLHGLEASTGGSGGDVSEQLVEAARGGHLESLRVLLATSSADVVRAKDKHGLSPLIHAVRNNQEDAARYLVRAGADPDDGYWDDGQQWHSLLMDAVHVNSTQWLAQLLRYGGTATFQDGVGTSLVLQAAHQGQLPLVKLLLEHRADPAAQNREGTDALMAAAAEGHAHVVAHFLSLDTSGVNKADSDGTTALMSASARGHTVCVQLLLEGGAAADARNSDGHSALMFAYNGRSQMRRLAERQRQRGKTLVAVLAALRKHEEVVRLLLERGADVRAVDISGRTVSAFDYSPAVPLELEPVSDSELADAPSGKGGAGGEGFADPRDYDEDARQGDLHTWEL